MVIELAEAAISVLGAMLRFVLVHIIWEVVLRLPGWWILRTLGNDPDPDPDGWSVVLISVFFWFLLLSLVGLCYELFFR